MSNLARWNAIFEEIGLQGDPVVHAELRRSYSEPGRAYHTLRYVLQCLELLEQVKSLTQHPQEIELAIWFHRAIYDVRRADNELRSADLAKEVLLVAGAEDDQIEAVVGLILATAPQAEPQTDDECLMVDIVHAVLGMRPGRYDEYERQLRQEYRHVPQSLYQSVRKKQISDWLDAPKIYMTEWFRARYEPTARSNLLRGLRRVSGRGWLRAAG